MSVAILANADDTRAALYCTTTGVTFGPIISEHGFDDASAQAQAFLASLPRDARTYAPAELRQLYFEWRRDSRCEGCRVELVTSQCDAGHYTCGDCTWVVGEGSDETVRCTRCDDDAEERAERRAEARHD